VSGVASAFARQRNAKVEKCELDKKMTSYFDNKKSLKYEAEAG
jgi:hypothetical protein